MSEGAVPQNPTPTATPKGGGCGPMAFLLIFLLLGALVFGANAGIGYYGSECGDLDLMDCIEEIMAEEEEAPGGTVAATGPYSYKDNSITMTANIPLEGGAVTGTVSGDCNGKVTGSFDGANNGVISGKLNGTCTIFFVNVPASATYSGVVNKDNKTVPISFNGSGGGFSHQDSMSLAY